MKFLILILLFPNHQCADQIKSVQEIDFVAYTAATRGSSFSCKINSSRILIQSQGGESFEKTREISSEEWKTISRSINDLNPDSISDYTSSTNSRALDRSRMAGVMISVNQVLYESEAFDEGNPPAELKPLVDKIIALAKTVD